MVRTWAEEMAKTKLRINLVDPGATRTSMRADAYPAEDPMTLPAPEDMVDIFVELAEENCTRHGERLHAQNR